MKALLESFGKDVFLNTSALYCTCNLSLLEILDIKLLESYGEETKGINKTLVCRVHLHLDLMG